MEDSLMHGMLYGPRLCGDCALNGMIQAPANLGMEEFHPRCALQGNTIVWQKHLCWHFTCSEVQFLVPNSRTNQTTSVPGYSLWPASAKSPVCDLCLLSLQKTFSLTLLHRELARKVFRDYRTCVLWVVLSFLNYSTLATSPSDSWFFSPASHFSALPLISFAWFCICSQHSLQSHSGAPWPSVSTERGKTSIFPPQVRLISGSYCSYWMTDAWQSMRKFVMCWTWEPNSSFDVFSAREKMTLSQLHMEISTMETTTRNSGADSSTALYPAASTLHTYSSVVILQITLGVLGILSNSTVVAVFATHKKYRKKIPNIFIINQVSVFFFFWCMIGCYIMVQWEPMTHNNFAA